MWVWLCVRVCARHGPRATTRQFWRCRYMHNLLVRTTHTHTHMHTCTPCFDTPQFVMCTHRSWSKALRFIKSDTTSKHDIDECTWQWVRQRVQSRFALMLSMHTHAHGLLHRRTPVHAPSHQSGVIESYTRLENTRAILMTNNKTHRCRPHKDTYACSPFATNARLCHTSRA